MNTNNYGPHDNVVIGVGSTSNHNYCVVIGNYLETDHDYQVIIGNTKVQTSKTMSKDEYEELASAIRGVFLT